MQESHIHEIVIRNFYRERVAPRSTIVREWEKFSPEEIYKFLKNCSIPALPKSKELINLMTQKRWTLKATAHEGGKNPNAPLHITIKIGSSGPYHLNCKEFSGRNIHVINKIKNPKLLHFIEDKLSGEVPVFIELDLPNAKVVMSKRQFGNMLNQLRPVDFLTTNIDKNKEKEYKKIVEQYLSSHFKWLKAAHS